MKKWILFLGFVFPICVQAQTSGNCGPKDDDGNFTSSCTYTYDTDTQTLTISGTTMADFEYPAADTPWKSFTNKNIVIEEGMTNVGNFAFIDSNVQKANLPESLTSVGTMSFFTSDLKEIDLPKKLTTIGYGAFNDCSIKNVVIPDGVTKLNERVFSSNPIETLIIPEGVTEIDEYAFYCNGCDSTASGRAMPLKDIYCSSAQTAQCQKAVSHLGENINIHEYVKIGDAYYVDGKFYKHANDLWDRNNIKKRIYTIDEANRVTGDKNRVSIKYR